MNDELHTLGISFLSGKSRPRRLKFITMYEKVADTVKSSAEWNRYCNDIIGKGTSYPLLNKERKKSSQ